MGAKVRNFLVATLELQLGRGVTVTSWTVGRSPETGTVTPLVRIRFLIASIARFSTTMGVLGDEPWTIRSKTHTHRAVRSSKRFVWGA